MDFCFDNSLTFIQRIDKLNVPTTREIFNLHCRHYCMLLHCWSCYMHCLRLWIIILHELWISWGPMIKFIQLIVALINAGIYVPIWDNGLSLEFMIALFIHVTCIVCHAGSIMFKIIDDNSHTNACKTHWDFSLSWYNHSGINPKLGNYTTVLKYINVFSTNAVIYFKQLH